MLKILYLFVMRILLVSLLTANSNAQVADDFDSYTAGQRLACQNPTEWTTWNNSPCSIVEDAMVSNAFSLSTPNSVVITPNRDLVKLLGKQTSGIWYLSLNTYIPSGKHGYFNILSKFTSGTSSYYAMECIFSLIKPGTIRLLANHTETNFPFLYDTWNFIQVVMNLDSDQAEFWANDSLVFSWQWTKGNSTGTGPLEIDAINFYGLTANDQMYVDNFWFHSSSVAVGIESNVSAPLTFILEQNYPNPFNPTTKIKYRIAEAGLVKLAIFNILGQEVRVLVNEIREAGFYDIDFNAESLPSGIYLYKIQTPQFTETKKMLLTK